jgi:hypothetical protein
MKIKHNQLSSNSKDNYFIDGEDLNLSLDKIEPQIQTEKCSFKYQKTKTKDNGEEIITELTYANEVNESLTVWFYTLK